MGASLQNSEMEVQDSSEAALTIVEDLISSGFEDTAFHLLKEAGIDKPDKWMAAINAFEASGDEATAVAFAELVSKRRPRNRTLYISLGRLAIKSGHRAAFQTLVLRALEHLDETQLIFLIGAWGKQLSPFDVFNAFLALKDSVEPDEWTVLTPYFLMAAMNAGQADEARALISDVSGNGSASSGMASTLAQIKLGIWDGRYEDAAVIAISALDEYPHEKELLIQAVELSSKTGRYEEFLRLIRQLLTAPGMKLLGLKMLDEIYCPGSLLRSFINTLISDDFELPNTLNQNWLKVLLETGHYELCKLAVSRAIRNGHIASDTPFLRYCRTQDLTPSPRYVDEESSELIFVPHSEAVATMICLPGHWNKFSHIPAQLLDTHLAEYPLNIVYVRDFKSYGACDGLSTLSDTYRGTLSEIGRLVSRFSALPILTFGVSIGGFHAVHLAKEVGARTAISFGGPAQINNAPGKLTNLRNLEKERSFLTSRMRPEDCDSLWVLQQHPEIKLHYVSGDGYEPDLINQKTLQQFPNTQIHELENLGFHAALPELIVRDQFRVFMNDILASAHLG